jgi:membrane fusion protein, heavy metal efflux system
MKMLIRVVALAGPLALAACGGRGNQASEMTSFSAGTAAPEQAEAFTVPADQMAHVQVAAVAKVSLARMLRLTGTVAYNAFQTTPVITQMGGPVSRILVVPGQHVKVGQPLLEIASPDFSMLRSSYLKARDAYDLADKADKRAKDLFAHGAVAQADVEQAESGRAQAQADLEANEQAIRIIGISNPEELVAHGAPAATPLLAPQAGEVVERLCAQGQLVQAGATQCFTISDMSSVWVLVNIYQNDLGAVKVGDGVTITNEAYPDALHGRIQYLAPALDPATRTLPARIAVPNPGERLKKDMYVTAEVQAGASDALVVPDAAVLRDTENLPYVYVQTGDRQFARRPVTLGDSQDGRTAVTGGLQAGEKVASDGSLFLQFQSSLQR